MKTAFRSRLGRLVAAALVVVASVVGPSFVVADGLPDEPNPKPLNVPDLSAPAEVAMTVVSASFMMLDATTF